MNGLGWIAMTKVPSNLKPIGRKVRRFQRFLTYKERWRFWAHLFRGHNYATYYAAHMDRLANIDPDMACGHPDDKGFQFEYLIDHGLKKQSSMLDYGCGTVSAGALFIDYLDAGKYTGVDISQKCLEAGCQRIESLGLGWKKPHLVHLSKGSLESLPANQFDIIWAQSVMTHMPPNDIEQLLRNIQPYMHPSSVFYATFAFIPGKKPLRRLYRHWYYNLEFFLHLAKELSLQCNLMPDWRYIEPSGEIPPNDKLVQFTLLKS